MNSKQVSNMLDINMRLINKITDIARVEEVHASVFGSSKSEVSEYLISIQTHLEQAQWELNQLEDKLVEQEEHE